MNEMNLPEMQLRFWRPRRPAAGVKRRIFKALHAPAVIWNWHQLAPATAGLLFALLLMQAGHDDGLPSRKPELLSAACDRSAATAFSDSAQELQNHLTAVTFDWTNHSVFRSSIRSQSGSGPSTNLSN